MICIQRIRKHGKDRVPSICVPEATTAKKTVPGSGRARCRPQLCLPQFDCPLQDPLQEPPSEFRFQAAVAATLQRADRARGGRSLPHAQRADPGASATGGPAAGGEASGRLPRERGTRTKNTTMSGVGAHAQTVTADPGPAAWDRLPVRASALQAPDREATSRGSRGSRWPPLVGGARG